MDLLRSAAPLARCLLAVGDARGSGALHARRGHEDAVVRLAQGRVVAVDGVACAPLGDVLRACGELALPSAPRGASGSRIGVRLIAAGATSGSAVERALSVQLACKLDALLRTPPTALRFVPVRDARPRPHSYSLDAAGAALASLLRLAHELPSARREALGGQGALTFTKAGARRLRTLDERELARAAELLTQAHPGAWAGDVGVLRGLLRGEPLENEHAVRACLRVLGMAIEAHSRSLDGYALLLRKRRELARKERAEVLLGASRASDARRALRKLAAKLHPDRFGGEDVRLHRLFGQTLAELSRAEHALRAT